MKTLNLIFISLLIASSMFGSSLTIPSKKVNPYNSLSDIFRTIDPNKLPHAPGPIEDEFQSTYIDILTQKATEIRNYISTKYYEDLSNLHDKEVIALGIIMVPFETRDMFPGYITNEQAFNCMMTALGAATGIGALISAWNSGATASTILSTLKGILKISYGWFAVGYAVYKFGACVGWW